MLRSFLILALAASAFGWLCENNGPCQNGGSCTQTSDTGVYCTCTSRYMGTNCEYYIQGCETSPCQNGGTCTQVYENDRAYECACPYNGTVGWNDDYTGLCCQIPNPRILDLCRSNPCQNGGTCRVRDSSQNSNGYDCQCPSGFQGDWCEIDNSVDPCASNPCQNDGVCSRSSEYPGTFSCACSNNGNLRRAGRTCEQEYTRNGGCDTIACSGGATCSSPTSPSRYCVNCPQTKRGQYCNETRTVWNQCALLPCENGGTCIDTFDSYYCRCRPGFYGRNCEEYYNPCVSANPCVNGYCYLDNNEEANYGVSNDVSISRRSWLAQCQCGCGWTGKHCDIPLGDVCAANPCWNGGTCVPRANNDGFRCICTAGFGGDYCHTSLQQLYAQNPCVPNVCLNGGLCTITYDWDEGAQANCGCPYPYAGRACEYMGPDFCAYEPCQNGGLCFNNKDNTFGCACQTGWEGDYCDIEANAAVPVAVSCLTLAVVFLAVLL